MNVDLPNLDFSDEAIYWLIVQQPAPKQIAVVTLPVDDSFPGFSVHPNAEAAGSGRGIILCSSEQIAEEICATSLVSFTAIAQTMRLIRKGLPLLKEKITWVVLHTKHGPVLLPATILLGYGIV
jgi:hypothetical protein